jgi:uncharacterized protein YggU (UPF0235/DUF167 family)
MSYKFSVKVTTRAKKELVQYIDEQKILRVWTKAAPVDGKANSAIIELIAEYLDISKSLIKIKTGLATSNKIIEIDADIKEEDLIKKPRLF